MKTTLNETETIELYKTMFKKYCSINRYDLANWYLERIEEIEREKECDDFIKNKFH